MKWIFLKLITDNAQSNHKKSIISLPMAVCTFLKLSNKILMYVIEDVIFFL